VKSFDHTIRPGVVLFLGGADDCTDRVQLNSGTIAAPDATPAGRYEEGARIPRSDWRSLTPADRKALIAESCPKLYGSAIGIVRLPSQLLEPFASLREASAEYRSEEELIPIIGSENCSQGTDAIIAHLQRHFQRFRIRGGLHARQGGIEAHLPCLQTVTADPKTDAFIGLHVDNFYDFSLSRRERSPNRVCVNLGSEDRFFVFLNIPIGQLCKLMKNKMSGEKDFMRSFPSYPVVRVRIRPGEGYVAPTENIVHDGSSIDMNAMDITFSVRGRFSLSPT